jgi:hypothetical protein
MSWRIVLVVVAVLSGCALAVSGCEKRVSSGQTDQQVVVQESGSIELDDTTDPNHSNLPYDTYTFEAKRLDRVRVEVVTRDFTPLLKLVEVATGAPLWEWEEAYSDENALIYTIAGPGTYEARVYATSGGTGTYQITVILND